MPVDLILPPERKGLRQKTLAESGWKPFGWHGRPGWARKA
jgi:hypothetical protein